MRQRVAMSGCEFSSQCKRQRAPYVSEAKAESESAISLIYGLEWCFYLAMQPKRKTLITLVRRYIWLFSPFLPSAFFARARSLSFPLLVLQYQHYLDAFVLFSAIVYRHRHHTIASHISHVQFPEKFVFLYVRIW